MRCGRSKRTVIRARRFQKETDMFGLHSPRHIANLRVPNAIPRDQLVHTPWAEAPRMTEMEPQPVSLKASKYRPLCHSCRRSRNSDASLPDRDADLSHVSISSPPALIYDR